MRPDVVRPSPASDGGIQTPPGTAGPLPPVGSPMDRIRGGKTDSNSAGRSPTSPLTVSRPPPRASGHVQTSLRTVAPPLPAVLFTKGQLRAKMVQMSARRSTTCALTVSRPLLTS